MREKKPAFIIGIVLVLLGFIFSLVSGDSDSYFLNIASIVVFAGGIVCLIISIVQSRKK